MHLLLFTLLFYQLLPHRQEGQTMFRLRHHHLDQHP